MAQVTTIFSRNRRFFIAVMMGAVLFFLQDRWFIMNTDDFSFSTISELVTLDDGRQVIVHDHAVQSWQDAVKSQAACYVRYNGRVVVHALAQWFSGTKSEGFTAVANSVVWMILFGCMLILGFGRDKWRTGNIVVAFAVMWLLMPNALRMFTSSIACTTNYLWTGAANLLLLVVLDHVHGREGGIAAWAVVLAALLSLLAGAMQESYSIGMSAGLIVFLLVNRGKASRAVYILVVAYLVGTALCALAPSNFARSDKLGHVIEWRAVADAVKVPVITLTALAAVVAWLVRPHVVIELLKRHVVIVTAMVVNLAFAVVVAYTMPWQLTCISLFAAILLLQLYNRLVGKGLMRVFIPIVAAVATVAVYCPMHGYRHEVWKAQHAMMARALTTTTGVVDVKEAFDADKKYLSSWAAPLLSIYLRNEVTPLVFNDKLVAPVMLSKYLTRCANPELVQAILPDRAEVITRTMDQGAVQVAQGVEAINYGAYTVVRSRDESSCQMGDATARQRWRLDGYHYSLYMGRLIH